MLPTRYTIRHGTGNIATAISLAEIRQQSYGNGATARQQSYGNIDTATEHADRATARQQSFGNGATATSRTHAQMTTMCAVVGCTTPRSRHSINNQEHFPNVPHHQIITTKHKHHSNTECMRSQHKETDKHSVNQALMPSDSYHIMTIQLIITGD